jgi:hypothetical protein
LVEKRRLVKLGGELMGEIANTHDETNKHMI